MLYRFIPLRFRFSKRAAHDVPAVLFGCENYDAAGWLNHVGRGRHLAAATYDGDPGRLKTKGVGASRATPL